MTQRNYTEELGNSFTSANDLPVGVRVEGPEEVKEEYREMLEKALREI